MNLIKGVAILQSEMEKFKDKAPPISSEILM